MTSASVSSEKTSVMRFTIKSRARWSAAPPGADLPGVSATTMAPTNGIAPATVSQGKVLISSPALPVSQPHQHKREYQRHGSQEHEQRIRADEARLHPAQPARQPAERRRHGVDQAVDAPVIEVDRQAGQPLAGPHQQ